MSDCENVQCKQVHLLLDSLLERFGRMGSPQQPSAAKMAIVCDEIRRIEDSESALRAELEALKKERDELRRDLAERGDQIAQAARHDFACFRCGDGSTPLYCLNCAEEMLRIKCTDNGEIAYEAYRRYCNYWTPTWEELKPDIQAGFSAAAKAVEEAMW